MEKTKSKKVFTRTEEKLAKQINNHIKMAGMSKKQLAEDVGVTPTTISRFLLLKEGLSFGTIEKIFARLGIKAIVIDYSEHHEIILKRMKFIESYNKDKEIITLTEAKSMQKKKLIKRIEDNIDRGIYILKKYPKDKKN